MVGESLVIILLLAILAVAVCVCFTNKKILDLLYRFENKPTRKELEERAEKILAGEDDNDDLIIDSLYRNKQGKYSYLAFKENKARKQNKSPQEFIDDYEMLAEQQEKEIMSKYGR